MSENIIKYQCPSCHAPLHFDANEQMIVCDFCDSKYPEDYFNEQEQNAESDVDFDEQIDWEEQSTISTMTQSHEIMDNQTGFNCTSCGAEVVSDGNTAATECMYCGNPIVLTDNVSGMLKPDLILPFKIDKTQAESKLEQFYLKKILLPKEFKDRNRISKIVGMYVPFWLYSAKGDGGVSYNATKVRSWRDGDYIVTETRHFKVKRAGSLEFEKIPVDASKKMEDNYMDGLEPYNYSDLEDFSPQYMAGYFADKFDVDVDTCLHRASARVVNSTKDKFKSTVSGYTTVSETFSNVRMISDSVKYSLLPVWMLNTKFEDKIYQFAINGQTGKVSGDLPIDKKKQSRIFLTVAAISAAVIGIIGYNFLT